MLTLPDHYRKILDPILRAYAPDAEILAYGSRVNGRCHEGSDLDLVIRNPNDLTKRFEALYDLRDAIRESNIPILVDVMDWAIIPKSFHQQIAQENHPW